jgi:hypothetical protein
MSDRRFVVTVLATSLLLFVMLVPTPASAHSASTYYPHGGSRTT